MPCTISGALGERMSNVVLNVWDLEGTALHSFVCMLNSVPFLVVAGCPYRKPPHVGQP